MTYSKQAIDGTSGKFADFALRTKNISICQKLLPYQQGWLQYTAVNQPVLLASVGILSQCSVSIKIRVNGTLFSWKPEAAEILHCMLILQRLTKWSRHAAFWAAGISCPTYLQSEAESHLSTWFQLPIPQPVSSCFTSSHDHYRIIMQAWLEELSQGESLWISINNWMCDLHSVAEQKELLLHCTYSLKVCDCPSIVSA